MDMDWQVKNAETIVIIKQLCWELSTIFIVRNWAINKLPIYFLSMVVLCINKYETNKPGYILILSHLPWEKNLEKLEDDQCVMCTIATCVCGRVFGAVWAALTLICCPISRPLWWTRFITWWKRLFTSWKAWKSPFISSGAFAWKFILF